MNGLKITGLILTAIIAVSLIALPSTIVVAQPGDQRPPVKARSWWRNITANYTFEELLSLAYLVRNESYPMFNWTMNYNITLSARMLARGDYFLHLAINESETNESMAKAHLLVATMIYSHAPVTAYILLGKTIRDHLGVNRTITNETVEAVLNITYELKGLVDEVIGIAEANNITIPDRVLIFKTIAEGYLNTSIKLLEQGYVRAAFRFAVKAYHRYVLAYSFVIKATIAQKLRLGEPENLTLRMGLRRMSKIIIERILSHLPPRVRDFILERIRGRVFHSPEELRHVIRDIMIMYHRMRMRYMIERAAVIATHVIIFASRLPTETGQAVREWLVEEGFVQGGMGGMGRWINFWKLYRYVENTTWRVYEQTNATGIALINATLNEISSEITSVTGIEVDLAAIFYTQMSMYISFHGHHRG